MEFLFFVVGVVILLLKLLSNKEEEAIYKKELKDIEEQERRIAETQDDNLYNYYCEQFLYGGLFYDAQTKEKIVSVLKKCGINGFEVSENIKKYISEGSIYLSVDDKISSYEMAAVIMTILDGKHPDKKVMTGVDRFDAWGYRFSCKGKLLNNQKRRFLSWCAVRMRMSGTNARFFYKDDGGITLTYYLLEKNPGYSGTYDVEDVVRYRQITNGGGIN